MKVSEDLIAIQFYHHREHNIVGKFLSKNRKQSQMSIFELRWYIHVKSHNYPIAALSGIVLVNFLVSVVELRIPPWCPT